MKGRLRSFKLYSLALLMAVTSVTMFLHPKTADAATRPEGVAFFNNVYVGASTRAVIWYDGSPYGGNSLPTFNTKAEFINHMKYLLGGDGSSWQWRNQSGAQYIVQRMRAGNDFGRPDAADIADWESRINQSNVTIANEITTDAQTSGFVTLGGYDGGADTVANRDDVAYTKSSGINTDMTLAFYQNGSLIFRIRYNCGNPLGNLPGIQAENYDLNPVINGNPQNSESGGTVSLSPTVNNTGTTASASTVQWQVTRFQVNPGNPLPVGNPSASAPAAYYGNINPTSVASGTQSFPVNLSAIAVANQVLGDFAVGTRICFGLSVQPMRHDDARWRHSNPFCVTISKSPKIQIEGGDLYVGRGGSADIITSTTRKNVGGQDRTYGSWTEYAVSATGSISGMASGSGYSGGNIAGTICGVSYLTITNAGTGNCSDTTPKGSYALNATLPDIGGAFVQPINMGGPNFNVSTAASGVYTRAANGVINIQGGTIQPGRWVVINAPGATVTIQSNITYANGPFTRLNEIPQVVIIADNILIDSGVSNVDSWLIASGTNGRINTCNGIPYPLVDGSTSLHAGLCNSRLTVNGPVIARQLLLNRTAGSETGPNSGLPAEVFNLRSDAYLWAAQYSSTAGRIPTVSSKELPPRF